MHRGYCGIDCSICPSYIAYHSNNQKLREELAQKYSTPEKKMNPNDFNCAGCKAKEGIIFDYCKECQIRICASSRGLEDCSYCTELPCDKIDKVVEFMGSDEPLQVLYKLREEREK